MRMRRQPMSRSFLFRVRRMALAVLVALVAAAAPEKAPVKPAQPTDVPLLAPLEIKPENLAVLASGARFAPQSGPWCALSDLYAGASPDVAVWDLRGPLSARPGRIQVGAATLFLSGFGPGAAVRELATLQAGDDRECWALLNTEEVRPIPKLLLENGFIRDRNGIFNGDPEIEAYAQFLVMAHYTSATAFARTARHDVTYAHLFNEPEHYRGRVVHLSGRLIRLLRFDPPDEARAEGVGDLYEGWILTDKYGENPACIVFTDLPAGLKVDAHHKPDIEVGFDGYFYKRYRYKAFDTKKDNQFRDAPLVIGHTLTGQFGPEAPAEAASDNWGHHLMWVFLGVVGGALAVVIGLTCWFHYHDRRVRHRLRASRYAEFVPPSAEGEWFTEQTEPRPLRGAVFLPSRDRKGAVFDDKAIHPPGGLDSWQPTNRTTADAKSWSRRP